MPDCFLAIDSDLSAAGLFCCYALCSSFVDFGPLFVCPSGCLALGSGSHVSVIIPPASSFSSEFLQVLFFSVAQSLQDVVTPLGSRPFSSSTRTKASSEPFYHWVVSCLRDGATCLRSRLCSSSVRDCNEDYPSYWWDWFQAFVMGSPVSGRGCVLQPAIVTKAIPPYGGIGSGPS